MALKKILLYLAFALFLSPISSIAHEVDPLFKTNNAECSIWGYTNMTVGSEKEFVANPIRVRTSCKYQNFSFFMENDLAGLRDTVDANYITQAWIGYTFSKDGLVGNMFSDTTIRAGSLLTAGGLYLPAAYLGVMVESPNNPFHHYGYGAQIQTKITPDITFIGDITGATGPAFNQSERFDRIETSQRLVWSALKNEADKRTMLQVSLSHGWSDVSHKIGVGVKVSPTETLDLYGGIYHATESLQFEKPQKSNGGYALADYKLWSMEGNKLDLRVHAMFEKRDGTENSYTGTSVGSSLSLPENGEYGRWSDSSITVDFKHSTESNNDGPKFPDNTIMFRTRIFF